MTGEVPEPRVPGKNEVADIVVGSQTAAERYAAATALGQQEFRDALAGYQAAYDRGDIEQITFYEERLRDLNAIYPEVRAFVSESQD